MLYYSSGNSRQMNSRPILGLAPLSSRKFVRNLRVLVRPDFHQISIDAGQLLKPTGKLDQSVLNSRPFATARRYGYGVSITASEVVFEVEWGRGQRCHPTLSLLIRGFSFIDSIFLKYSFILLPSALFPSSSPPVCLLVSFDAKWPSPPIPDNGY